MFSRSLVIALALSACALSVSSATAQEVGTRAPAFEVAGAAKPIRLADLKSQVVYVDFWASWCAPCKLSFPFMNEMHAKYGPRGFTIVAVTLDRKRADADRFLVATPAKFLIGYDTENKLAEIYKPQGMPTSFLIGADGKVRAVHVGFRDSDREGIEREIQAALAAARK